MPVRVACCNGITAFGLSAAAGLVDGFVDGFVDFILGAAVEDGGDGLEPEHRRGPAEVGLENLADVHSAGHAQRIEQDVHGRSIFQKRHVFFGDDAGDDALVAVAAGHLIADRKLALGGDIDLDHLQHA